MTPVITSIKIPTTGKATMHQTTRKHLLNIFPLISLSGFAAFNLEVAVGSATA